MSIIINMSHVWFPVDLDHPVKNLPKAPDWQLTTIGRDLALQGWANCDSKSNTVILLISIFYNNSSNNTTSMSCSGCAPFW